MSAIHLNSLEPTHMKTSFHLQPAYWCGKQWRKISDFDNLHPIKIVAKAILMIFPAIFVFVLSIPSAFLAITFPGSYSSSERNCLVRITPAIKNKLQPDTVPSATPAEEKAAIEQKLSNSMFSLCSLEMGDFEFPTDGDRREAMFNGAQTDLRGMPIEINRLYKAVLNVKRPAKTAHVYDAFRGPIPTSVNSTDILEFLLGIDMDPNKKYAVQRSILSLSSIQLYMNTNMSRMEMIIKDPGTFYPSSQNQAVIPDSGNIHSAVV